MDDQRRRRSTGIARAAVDRRRPRPGGSRHGDRVLGSPEQDVRRQVRGVVGGLRERRRERRGRRRRRKQADVDAAERARGVAAQPQVDALGVEAVLAPGQEPGGLAVREFGEAHGALQRLAACPVLRLVNRHRQRPEHRRFKAAASGIASSQRAALLGARWRPHHRRAVPRAAAATDDRDSEVVVQNEREGQGDEEEDYAGEDDVAAHRRGRAPPRDGRRATTAACHDVLRQR